MLKKAWLCFRMSPSFVGNNPSLRIHSFSKDQGKCWLRAQWWGVCGCLLCAVETFQHCHAADAVQGSKQRGPRRIWGQLWLVNVWNFEGLNDRVFQQSSSHTYFLLRCPEILPSKFRPIRDRSRSSSGCRLNTGWNPCVSFLRLGWTVVWHTGLCSAGNFSNMLQVRSSMLTKDSLSWTLLLLAKIPTLVLTIWRGLNQKKKAIHGRDGGVRREEERDVEEHGIPSRQFG